MGQGEHMSQEFKTSKGHIERPCVKTIPKLEAGVTGDQTPKEEWLERKQMADRPVEMEALHGRGGAACHARSQWEGETRYSI